MVDDKFIDRFIQDAESVSPGNNSYIFTFNSPGKYAKSAMGIYAPYGSEKLNSIVSRISGADKVFVHWFNDALMPYIDRLHPDTKLYLLFWGGDFLEQSEHSLNFNLEKITRRVYDRINRYAMFHFSMNPFSYFRQLKMFLSVDRRWREWRQSAVSTRKKFMERLDFFCHWNEADFDAVKSEYGGKAEFCNFFYDPRFDQFPDEVAHKNKDEYTTVWLGNSATFPNNHLDAFEVLGKFKNEQMQLVLPVSYGNRNYAELVEKKGRRIFGGRLKTLKEFLPVDRYFHMLRHIDVVVMFHNRTQAAGNIFAFLRMGKKVYLKRESSIFELARRLGIIVFEANNIQAISFKDFASPLSNAEQEQNRVIVNNMFSHKARDSYMRALLN